MRKTILLFLLFLSVTAVRTLGQNITFSHLTTDDGLSQFSVNSLYIDERGIIWIGTREGLNRYNGNDIKSFKLKKNDPNSLFSNTVLRITGNKNGKVYLLCTDGVAEFDMTTQRFKTLLQGNVDAIYYNEKLYIGKREEVFVFNENTNNFDLYYHLAGKDINLSCLHLDEKKNLWMGTTSNGVYCLSDDKQLSQPITKGNIASIYEDSSKELWIGSWEEGLYRIRTNGTIDNFRHDPKNPNSICSDFVRSCCEDNLGNLWIGTFHGLNRYDKSTGQFQLYTANDNKPDGLTHSSIWCIVKDEQGTLWLGTYFGGVNYFNPEYEIYTRYKVGDTEKEGLSSPIVGRMTEDKDGNLWICTEGGGVNVYNRKNNTYRWYRHEEGKNSISHNNVKAIYYDRTEEIMWIGTHLGGLNKLDLRTNRFTVYRMKAGDPTTLPSDIVRDIVPYEDKLIIATQNGVCLFNPATGTCEHLFKDTKEGRNIGMVASLYIDKDETLWVSATGEGVYSYRFDTGKLTHYAHNPSIPNTLSNNNVNNIMQDSNGNLWFSTSGSGLDRYRKESNDFENFDMQKDGLSSDCIYEVFESSIQKGDLLLITNQGFSQFDYPQKKFYNYGTENGFPLTAVNENALFVTHDGEVFLGGIQGMISFWEKKLHFTPKSYSIILSRLLVNGKEITAGDDTGILEQSIAYTPEISLKADQSMFSIEYATSNFIPANRNEIVYRLEGFSDEWNHTDRKQTLITYTNLNPGKYTLVIKSQRDGIKEAKLLIIVLPPWYETWWAYLIYTIVTISLLWYLIQNYNSRIKLRESLKYEKKHIEDLEALNQSKLRFFTNISHEFRTPLTLIVSQLEMLMERNDIQPLVYNKLVNIHRNTLRMKRLITELLDFRKQEQGFEKFKYSKQDIYAFLDEIYLSFKEYARGKQINLEFLNKDRNLEVWFDVVQLEKVIYNLLSNAFKYTSLGGTVSLSVQEYENSVVILISDTGIGIAEKSLDKIFDRFYQVDSTDNQKGTGIGLALAKSIIEAHKGKISVRSMEGKGTTFVVELPLGDSHIADSQKVATPDIDSSCISELTMYGDKALTDVMDDENPANESENTKSKILIVEDNEELADILCDFLRAENYTVSVAKTGEKALSLYEKYGARLIVLDIMLPGIDGFAVCRKIREESDTPILIVSAKVDKEDKLNGLILGADDYIEKPYDIDIMLAKIAGIFKRRYAVDELIDGDIRVNKVSRTVCRNDIPIEMTVKEFELLVLLIENKGRILTKEYLFNQIWGSDSFSEQQTLTVHIKRLRQKIEYDPKNPKHIQTVWGVGYKYESI